MSYLADSTDLPLEFVDAGERLGNQLRDAHELLGLVRPAFRLVPRPSHVGLTALKCSAGCDLGEIELTAVDHREFERMLREDGVVLSCLACLGRHAFAYYAQSVLANFLGTLIAAPQENRSRAMRAIEWMRVFERTHVEAFSRVQRFLIASALAMARSRGATLGVVVDRSGAAIRAWAADRHLESVRPASCGAGAEE